MLSERWLFHKVIPYGFHPKNSIEYVYNYDSMNSFHMESMWKFHGIHLENDGIHLEKVWNPCGKTMESIHHSMESIWNFCSPPPFPWIPHGITWEG